MKVSGVSKCLWLAIGVSGQSIASEHAAVTTSNGVWKEPSHLPLTSSWKAPVVTEKTPIKSSIDDIQRLYDRAISGDRSAIDKLVNVALVEDFSMENNDTPIHIMARFGNAGQMDQLIHSGVNIDARTNKGDTALHIAISSESTTELIQSLINAGANKNLKNNRGDAPIVSALRFGTFEAVQLLVTSGVELSFDKQYTQPLSAAAGLGKVKELELLVSHGAEFDISNQYGESALYLAAINGQIQALQALIRLGANVDSVSNFGVTALHRAAEFGELEAVKVLIEAGADRRFLSPNDQLPIEGAIEKDQLEMVEVLINFLTTNKEKKYFSQKALAIMIKNKKLKMITSFFKLKSINFSEIDFDKLLTILKKRKSLTKTFIHTVTKLIDEKKASLKQNVVWYMSTALYTSIVIAAIPVFPPVIIPLLRNREED